MTVVLKVMPKCYHEAVPVMMVFIKPSSGGRILITTLLRALHCPDFRLGTVGCRRPLMILPFTTVIFLNGKR